MFRKGEEYSIIICEKQGKGGFDAGETGIYETEKRLRMEPLYVDGRTASIWKACLLRH